MLCPFRVLSWGNGYDVSYDASLSANKALGGLTYFLVNGGRLIPK